MSRKDYLLDIHVLIIIGKTMYILISSKKYLIESQFSQKKTIHTYIHVCTYTYTHTPTYIERDYFSYFLMYGQHIVFFLVIFHYLVSIINVMLEHLCHARLQMHTLVQLLQPNTLFLDSYYSPVSKGKSLMDGC